MHTFVSGGDLETQLGTTKKGGWKQDDSKLDMLAMISVMCDNLRYEIYAGICRSV